MGRERRSLRPALTQATRAKNTQIRFLFVCRGRHGGTGGGPGPWPGHALAAGAQARKHVIAGRVEAGCFQEVTFALFGARVLAPWQGERAGLVRGGKGG